MKKISQHSWAATMLVALCAVLSSFTLPGAHSFQLYVDSRLIVDQYVTRNITIPKVALNAGEENNRVILKYSECGRTVSGRTLTLKDEQDKVLKEWHFDGTTSGFKDPMTINVKDVVALKPNKGAMKLYYSSNDFKEGQQVALLVVGKDVTAVMK
ncbi:MAG TPA: hypothetical protein VF473_05570 [Cyclobacteriaceae bacterium]